MALSHYYRDPKLQLVEECAIPLEESEVTLDKEQLEILEKELIAAQEQVLPDDDDEDF
jgi:hypothetical protein